MALGSGTFTGQRSDPGQVSVRTAEERDELASQEVFAFVVSNEGAEHVDGFAVTQFQRRLDHENQIHWPLRIGGMVAEIPVQQVA